MNATLLFPAALLLLPVPLVARRLLRPRPVSAVGSLRVPFYRRLADEGGERAGSARTSAARWLLPLAVWALLVVATARPALVGEPVPLPVEARDLMLAIDLSGSMAQGDFTVDGRPAERLDVVKSVADDFIARRIGDRVGLVLFGERAYLQAPLTLDRDAVRSLLDEAEVGLTGQRTAIGDALAIAVKRLRERPGDSRVVVLLSDGSSNAGTLEPLAAARLAAELGIRVYTIGVGSERMVMPTRFGPQAINPSEDLDEDTLRRMAQASGGRYFRARDVEELAGIYAALDELEPVSGEPAYVRPSIELFFWPLGLAWALALLAAAWMFRPRAGLGSAREASAPRSSDGRLHRRPGGRPGGRSGRRSDSGAVGWRTVRAAGHPAGDNHRGRPPAPATDRPSFGPNALES